VKDQVQKSARDHNSVLSDEALMERNKVRLQLLETYESACAENAINAPGQMKKFGHCLYKHKGEIRPLLPWKRINPFPF
jgi:hypothetical protein